MGLCGIVGAFSIGAIPIVTAHNEGKQLLVEVENSTYSTVVIDNETTLISNQHINTLVTGEEVRSNIKDELDSAEQKTISDDVVSGIKDELSQGGSVIQKNKEAEEVRKYKKWLKREINKHRTADGTVFNIPSSWNSAFKAYMGYQAVTDTSSPQYNLLRNKGYTDEMGLRMVDGRYCIAMGSGFASRIGTKIDIELTNGTIIPCILGDQKSDRHTKDGHMRCKSNGSVAEFIVDDNEFYKHKDSSGTVNFAHKGWDAKLKKVTVLG